METKSDFSRSFFIFNHEDGGYGTGKNPSGYIRIEVREGKGKLSCSVQNLKEDGGESLYRLYLAAAENSFLAVDAGTIPLKKGAGELKWEFDPANVGRTGRGIGGFNVYAVLLQRKSSKYQRIICPLAAYKGSKSEWRGRLEEEINRAMPVKSSPAAVLERSTAEKNSFAAGRNVQTGSLSGSGITGAAWGNSIAESIKAETAFENRMPLGAAGMPVPNCSLNCPANCPAASHQLEQQPRPEPADDYFTGKEPLISDQQPGEKAESEPYAEEDSFGKPKEFIGHSADELLADKRSPGLFQVPPVLASQPGYEQTVNYQTDDQIRPQQAEQRKAGGDIEKLKVTMDRCFERYDPFRSRRRDYMWWKINSPVNLNNALYQCNIKTPLLFSPALMMAHFKYRHLIAGIYSDKDKGVQILVCGVPGVYSIDERPFGELCRWAQTEGTRPRYGAFGYWLVYIDPDTGKFLNVI